MNSKCVLATPDYTKQIVVSDSSNTSWRYTAPTNGVLIGNLDDLAKSHIYVNGSIDAMGGNDSGNEGPVYVPLVKGDVVTCNVQLMNKGRFIPYKYVMIYI